MKKIIIIILCLSLLFTVAACSNNGKEESKKKLATILPDMSWDFQLQMHNGVKRAAQEFGYDYMSYDYSMDSERMLSGLDTLKASNVGAMYAIFLAPDSAVSFMEANPEIGVLTQGEVAKGAKAGTLNDYITLAEQFVDSLEYFVTQNNISKGHIGALWLSVCENEDSEYYAAMMDIKGVINKWCEGKEFKMTADYFPNDDEEAANMTAQILNSDPEVKFMFVFNNSMCIVAANEISASVADTSNYFLFSSEGDLESFRLIASKTSPYRACGYMDIEASGYDVGKQLINWIENGKMESVYVSKVQVDIRNVNEFID